MPLLLFCGFPSSGKTTRAIAIADYFAKNHKNVPVIILNEERFELNKEEQHSDPKKEKELRSFLRSNVNKHLTTTTLVILDYMSYIKGFRYELYCLSRSAKTTYCVLLCESTIKESQESNRIRDTKYSDELLKDLCGRMERPIETNRWDSPLISVFHEDSTPFEEIYKILFLDSKKSKDPVSTKSELKLPSSYVFDLENLILELSIDIINKINEAKMNNSSKYVRYNQGGMIIDIKTNLTMSDFKKMKLEFLSMNKLNPFQNPEMAKFAFLYFIKAKMIN